LIRFLLDQGLPRTAVSFLRAAGWDAVHVVELGMSRATDVEIIDVARQDHRVICTLDADFHALLATSGHSHPSVVRIRREGLKAKELADLGTVGGSRRRKRMSLTRREENAASIVHCTRRAVAHEHRVHF
jgi:predicted nuclease of predicted toxin-antitoxin system